jgi:hypothetical protein
MVDPDTQGGRVSPRELYGWRPLQGSLQLPSVTTGCEVVASAIRRALDRALMGDSVDELNQSHDRERGRPLYGMLRYESQGMRGQIYVWLFADRAETKINYAILLREEVMCDRSRRTVTGE